ncbi:MAG: 50S ribosomal protein L15 [Lacipirellulaceae bacterium]
MILDDVNRGIHKNRPRKRLGRGVGSGQGKTAGRGHKGHTSRSGYSKGVTFQGGAMRMIMRIPKRGFNNKFAQTVVVVNVGQINDAFDAGADVTIELLVAKNIAKGRFDELKILGDGELSKKLTIHGHRFSASAQEKIAAAGGAVVVVPGKVPVEDKKRVARDKNKAAKAALLAKSGGKPKVKA